MSVLYDRCVRTKYCGGLRNTIPPTCTNPKTLSHVGMVRAVQAEIPVLSLLQLLMSGAPLLTALFASASLQTLSLNLSCNNIRPADMQALCAMQNEAPIRALNLQLYDHLHYGGGLELREVLRALRGKT